MSDRAAALQTEPQLAAQVQHAAWSDEAHATRPQHSQKQSKEWIAEQQCSANSEQVAKHRPPHHREMRAHREGLGATARIEAPAVARAHQRQDQAGQHQPRLLEIGRDEHGPGVATAQHARHLQPGAAPETRAVEPGDVDIRKPCTNRVFG